MIYDASKTVKQNRMKSIKDKIEESETNVEYTVRTKTNKHNASIFNFYLNNEQMTSRVKSVD